MFLLDRIQALELDKTALEEQATFLKERLTRCEEDLAAVQGGESAEASALAERTRMLDFALNESRAASIKMGEEKAELENRINTLALQVTRSAYSKISDVKWSLVILHLFKPSYSF